MSFRYIYFVMISLLMSCSAPPKDDDIKVRIMAEKKDLNLRSYLSNLKMGDKLDGIFSGFSPKIISERLINCSSYERESFYQLRFDFFDNGEVIQLTATSRLNSDPIMIISNIEEIMCGQTESNYDLKISRIIIVNGDYVEQLTLIK